MARFGTKDARSNLANLVARQAAQGITYNASYQLSAGFAAAVQASMGPVRKQIKQMAELMERPSYDRARRTEIHRQVGELAQRSTIQAYGQLITKQEGAASKTHYRAGHNRLAGGIMRGALNNTSLFTATSDGIAFGNRKMLDAEARHWHRLAYGVGERGQGSHVQFEITYRNLVVGALGVDESPSTRPLRIPEGLWRSTSGEFVGGQAARRGTDTFTPWRRNRGKALEFHPTKGIRGRDFFATGVRRIARELPRFYAAWFDELYAQQKANAGAGARITTKLTRPVPGLAKDFKVRTVR